MILPGADRAPPRQGPASRQGIPESGGAASGRLRTAAGVRTDPAATGRPPLGAQFKAVRSAPESRGAKVTLNPVDARVWNAHVPLDPVIAKTLAARLKSGT